MPLTRIPLALTAVLVSLSGCGSDEPGPTVPREPAAAEQAGGAEATTEKRERRPACTVVGSFSPDAAGHTDDVVSLEDINAKELPRYEVDGPGDAHSHWEATGRGAVGARGPVKTYLVAFFDPGEGIGYRVSLTVFADSPNQNEVEVRSFDKAIGTSTNPADMISWSVADAEIDASGLADDGSGGAITFLTQRGGGKNSTGGTDYYYPLKVDLTFADCPPSA